MSQKIRLYISGPVSKGVAESQMVNWAKLLDDRHISTTFIVFYNKSNRKKFDHMQVSGMDAEFYAKKYINYLFIRELTYFFFIRSFLKNLKNPQNITIQTRSASFAFPLFLLKWLYSVKIVYEIRGAGEELIRKKYTRDIQNKLNDRLMLKMSEKIITVSEKLLTYKIGHHRLDEMKHKAMVIYGAADSSLFYYDPGLRLDKRKGLGIEKRFVILYIGMLDKEWQIPEVTFKLVADLMKQMKELYFLVITPDISVAEKCKHKYGIPDSDITIKASSQKDLNGYINASDMGLLLREDTLINNVASPTKFAEYLLAGLPVLISKNVGDYSEFTEKNKIGIITDIKNPDIRGILHIISNSSILANRENIQYIGKAHFSKQHFIDVLASIY